MNGMKALCFASIMVSLLAACGEDSPDSGLGSTTVSVPLDAYNGNDAGGCLAWTGEGFQGASASQDQQGEIDAQDCVLAFAVLQDGWYWVSGRTYDVALLTPEFDGDEVRHSTATAEDTVVTGTFDMYLFVAGATTDLSNPSGALSVAQLTVESIDTEAERVAVKITF